MHGGVLITFEGPEGSGKSTHIQQLAHFLIKNHIPVVLTREPGGTSLAGPLRDILLHAKTVITPEAELLLYEADRAQHLSECILPSLKKGAIVLCDRYTDSTLAYQGYGRGLPLKLIETLNRIASRNRKPDLTVLLDVDVERGLRQAARKSKRHDRLEKAGLAFHRRVRKGFLALARQEPRRFRIVKQQASIEATQRLIRQAVEPFLRRKMKSA